MVGVTLRNDQYEAVKTLAESNGLKAPEIVRQMVDHALANAGD